jgi:hypothetical protein
MRSSKLALLTYHLTTTHYGKPQINLKDRQLLYHLLENKREAGHEQMKRKPISSPSTLQQSLHQTIKNNNKNEGDVETFLNASCQLSLLIRAFTPTEVHNIINLLNPHKAPGYDLITGALLKNLPRKTINQLIRDLFNQPEIGRRLSRMWPEDLMRISSREPSEVGTCFRYTHPSLLLITLFKYLE